VQNQWMKLRGTRVQYGFLLHRNCFSLINMLENFIKFENFQIIKLKKEQFKVQFFFNKFENFIFFLKIENFIFFLKIQNFHKISKLSYYFKKNQNDKIELYVIKQLLHLNLINMRFYGAEYNNIELGIRLVQYCCTLLHKTSYWSRSSAVIV
jgi:hypothetical protein